MSPRRKRSHPSDKDNSNNNTLGFKNQSKSEKQKIFRSLEIIHWPECFDQFEIRSKPMGLLSSFDLN